MTSNLPSSTHAMSQKQLLAAVKNGEIKMHLLPVQFQLSEISWRLGVSEQTTIIKALFTGDANPTTELLASLAEYVSMLLYLKAAMQAGDPSTKTANLAAIFALWDPYRSEITACLTGTKESKVMQDIITHIEQSHSYDLLSAYIFLYAPNYEGALRLLPMENKVLKNTAINIISAERQTAYIQQRVAEIMTELPITLEDAAVLASDTNIRELDRIASWWDPANTRLGKLYGGHIEIDIRYQTR